MAFTGRGRIVGQIVDAGTGLPVEGAEVELSLLGWAIATGPNGWFAFEGLSASRQRLRIQHIGYGETEMEVEVPLEETVMLTLRLDPSPVELEPLVVEVERELRIRSLERQGFYDRREQAAGGVFFGPEYLVSWPGLGVHDIVARAGQRHGCSPAFYLDGRRVKPDQLPQIGDVAAVEVYRRWADLAGTASPWYASQDPCGMVLVWTWRGPNPFHHIDPWFDAQRDPKGRETELCQPERSQGAVVGPVLEGTVRDELTGVALPRARVTAWVGEEPGRQLKTNADQFGRYRLCALPIGDPITVRATFAGEEGTPVTLSRSSGEQGKRDLVVKISEPGRVVGRLFDRATGRPLAGADVVLEETDWRAQTDEGGYVLLGDVGPGDYILSARHLGYAEVRDSVSVLSDRTTEVRIELSADPVELAPLIVTALRDRRLEVRGFYERQRWGGRLGQGRFFERGEIERRSPARVSHLAEEVPGFTLRCAGPRSCAVVPTRAPGCNHVAVYLDGARVIDDEDKGDGPSLDELISPSELAAMEAYPGAGSLPAQFAGSTGRCGALVLWTW